MNNVNFVWCFLLCALAVWRLAHLLATENGPWNLVVRLRLSLGYGPLGRLMDSYYALCFLVAMPPAIWMSGSRFGFLVQWLALATVACLLERVTQRRRTNRRLYPLSISYLNKVIDGV